MKTTLTLLAALLLAPPALETGAPMAVQTVCYRKGDSLVVPEVGVHAMVVFSE